MNKNKKAETIVGVVIGLVIFTIICLGIVNIVGFNKDLTNEYENMNFENMLKYNSNIILKKLDLSQINENESFYIYKNNSTKNFEILTGTTNSGSKYVDLEGNRIDNINNFNLNIYKRIFELKKDIIDFFKTPNNLNNLVLYLDGQDVNGNGINPINDDSISTWTDKSSKNHNATGISEIPIFKENSINGFGSLLFDGVNDYLEISNNDDLNTSSTGYTEKSFAIVLKTGSGLLDNIQTIYYQGNTSTGYSINIENSELKAKIWGFTNNELNFGKVYQNNIYSIIIVQNSKSLISSYKTLSIYLNGKFISSITDINPSDSHNGNIYIGKDLSGNYFNGNIGEILSWNYSLNSNEVEGTYNYINNKWKKELNGDIKVNSVITNISKYNKK